MGAGDPRRKPRSRRGRCGFLWGARNGGAWQVARPRFHPRGKKKGGGLKTERPERGKLKERGTQYVEKNRGPKNTGLQKSLEKGGSAIRGDNNQGEGGKAFFSQQDES